MNYFGYNQKDIDAVAKIENEKRWSVLSEEQKRVLYKDECEVYVRMELVAALVLKDFIKKYQKLYGEYKTRTDINEEAGFIHIAQESPHFRRVSGKWWDELRQESKLKAHCDSNVLFSAFF